MRTLEDSYDLLEKLVDEERIYMDPAVSFHRLCVWICAPEKDLDSLLRSELGVGGDELLALLREGVPGRLERKYGITCFF